MLIAKTKSLDGCGLLQEYTLKDILGHGSFGIVFACKANLYNTLAGDETDFAVKLIDKVEAHPEDIEMETYIQKKLSHPNILKVHKIIAEKCFVCIVTDLYRGGDMVSCLRQKQPILSGKIVHIGRQMVEAVAYIHSRSIVHRDIKADNFLLDRKSMTDQQCRVVLADFGFACECKVGDRLRRQCGTKRYWSPELWDGNYALKVDVWALGVTTYGLVENTFPFQSEWDVKHKEVSCCRVVSAQLADFIEQLLTKQEGRRTTAAQARTHQWLIGQAQDDEEEEEEVVSGDWRPNPYGLMPEQPDPAVAERRLELVERLAGVKLKQDVSADVSQGSFDSCNATPITVFRQSSFTVLDKRASKLRSFEWRPIAEVERSGTVPLCSEEQDEASSTSESQDAQITNIMAQSGVPVQILAQMLGACGVDTSTFGKGDAKTLDRLAQEVEAGFSQLMLDASKHKSLVRVVDVVLLRLCVMRSGLKERYMIVSADEQPDGRVRATLNRLPGAKKLPHENVRNAASRTLLEIPHIQDCHVTFDFEHTEVFEVEEESPSYPGVRTVYRKEIVPGVVKQFDMRCVTNSSWRSAGDRSTKFFSLMTEEECIRNKVTLWAPTVGFEVCSLVPAPIGLKEEALGLFLEANDVDTSLFGLNNTKTLQELSTELITGKSALTKMQNGHVARIVDVVLLKIVKAGSSDMLVVAKETAVDGGLHSAEVVQNRLPGSKRRPDENQFLAAKRILQRQLNISENQITFFANRVRLFEEEKDSPSYPGLHTIYRKRIIPLELDVMQHSNRVEHTRKVQEVIPEEPIMMLQTSSTAKSVDAPLTPKSSRVSLLARLRRTMGRAWSPRRRHAASDKDSDRERLGCG